MFRSVSGALLGEQRRERERARARACACERVFAVCVCVCVCVCPSSRQVWCTYLRNALQGKSRLGPFKALSRLFKAL